MSHDDTKLFVGDEDYATKNERLNAQIDGRIAAMAKQAADRRTDRLRDELAERLAEIAALPAVRPDRDAVPRPTDAAIEAARAMGAALIETGAPWHALHLSVSGDGTLLFSLIGAGATTTENVRRFREADLWIEADGSAAYVPDDAGVVTEVDGVPTTPGNIKELTTWLFRGAT